MALASHQQIPPLQQTGPNRDSRRRSRFRGTAPTARTQNHPPSRDEARLVSAQGITNQCLIQKILQIL